MITALLTQCFAEETPLHTNPKPPAAVLRLSGTELGRSTQQDQKLLGQIVVVCLKGEGKSISYVAIMEYCY